MTTTDQKKPVLSEYYLDPACAGTQEIKWCTSSRQGTGTLSSIHLVEPHHGQNPINYLDLEYLCHDADGWSYFWLETLRDSGEDSDLFDWADENCFKLRAVAEFTGFKIAPVGKDAPGCNLKTLRYIAEFTVFVQAEIGNGWTELSLPNLDDHVERDEDLPAYPYSIR